MTHTTHWRSSVIITAIVTHTLVGFAQSKGSSISSSRAETRLSEEVGELIEERPNYTLAQIMPAYKIALKKGMFEVNSGLGHSDRSEEINRGQPNYIKKTPRADFIPVQLGYGLTNNTNFWISSKIVRLQDKVTKTNLEGTMEPQFSLSHSFRNDNSSITITGTYTADVGPSTLNSRAASRKEGNTLEGGASGELMASYFARLSPVIVGAEVSYLYRDSRLRNEETVALFTGQTTGQTQTRIEGGDEKTLRGVVELAAPFRIGATFGRTWVEEEEHIITYQPTTILYGSYYRNFMSAYSRIQINPKLSVLPSVAYTEAPDTTSMTGQQNQEISTQLNLRYRF